MNLIIRRNLLRAFLVGPILLAAISARAQSPIRLPSRFATCAFGALIGGAAEIIAEVDTATISFLKATPASSDDSRHDGGPLAPGVWSGDDTYELS